MLHFPHISTTMDPTADKPTLSVVPATIDDLETLTRIQYEATASTAPIHAIIFRNGATETIVAADLAGKKRGFSKPEVHYHKVVANARNGNDGGGGEIAAISRWYIWPEGRNDESWTRPYVYTPDEAHAPDDINHAAALEYYTKADAMKKRNIQNKPHLCKSTWPLSSVDHLLTLLQTFLYSRQDRNGRARAAESC